MEVQTDSWEQYPVAPILRRMRYASPRPPQREIQVNLSRLPRDGRLGTQSGLPTMTTSYSNKGSVSISGALDGPCYET